MNLAPAAVLLTVLAALLAGCAETDAPMEPAPPQEPPASPEPDFVTFQSHGDTPVLFRSNPFVFDASFPRLSFDVTRNVTGLLVELVWHDPVQDLDAYARGRTVRCDESGEIDPLACELGAAFDSSWDVAAVRDHGGFAGDPDSPSRAFASQEELHAILDLCGDPCTFDSFPRTGMNQHLVADVEWWNYVTVFYGDVPERFTAVPAA